MVQKGPKNILRPGEVDFQIQQENPLGMWTLQGLQSFVFA